MLRGIKELVDLLLLWGFMYVGSFLLMIVAIFYVIKSNPTPPTPIIHEHKIVQNIIQPPNRVFVERKICTRIDGCPEKNGTCPTCSVEKVWE